MVSVIVRYLFYQPVDEKIKTWPLRFPAKENPNMEKTSIVLQCDVEAKYRWISRKFSDKVFSPERSINQSNLPISVRLLFLFCPHIFMSRSYENRFINNYWVFFVRHWPVCFPLIFKTMIFFNNYWFF